MDLNKHRENDTSSETPTPEETQDSASPTLSREDAPPIRVTFRPRQSKTAPEPPPQTAPSPQPPKRAQKTEAPPRRAPSQRERVYPSPFAHDLTPIPTPSDAPRVISLNGRPVVYHHKVIPPFLFFGNPADEARMETFLQQVKKASQAGVHWHSFLVDFTVNPQKVQQALQHTLSILQKIEQVDPEALVTLRIVFGAERGWDKKYPHAAFFYADGSLAEPSVCDDHFWSDAERLLEEFLTNLLAREEGKHVLCIHLDRGEWFFHDEWGYDTSPSAEKKFREWLKFRYNGDIVALRSSWFDGRVRFESAPIPDYTHYPPSGESLLRLSRTERRWVDYHLFLSDAVVGRIQRLAWRVKKASEGRLLVAVSYGYTFEWDHPASGHLSLGKLLRTREVDIICAPPSYKQRLMGNTGAPSVPVDTAVLNRKLFISEEDFKTPISSGKEPDEFNPLMESPQDLESAHWRAIGSALAHKTGTAWMDLWGNGWLNTQAIWQRGQRVLQTLTKSLGVPTADPEVAILVDERSLAYLNDARAFKRLVQDAREAVLRTGVSAGLYLLSDLAHRPHFPQAKLYVFLNAWDIRPEVRSAIKSRLHRDQKTLFWLYAAGILENGRPALESVREVTGIAIKPQPFYSRIGTTLLGRRHLVSEYLNDDDFKNEEQVEPSYFAMAEEGCVVLGEYTQTGLPSFLVREISNENDPTQGWKTIFLGEPSINERILRGICQFAGVHIWSHTDDVAYIRPPFLALHCRTDGTHIITLPEHWRAFDLLNENEMETEGNHLRIEAPAGTTHLFFVGEEAAWEQIRNADLNAILNPPSIPEPEEPEPDESLTDFDVPILSLPTDDQYLSILAEAMEEIQPRKEPPPSRPRPRKPRPKPAPQEEVKEEKPIGFTFRKKN